MAGGVGTTDVAVIGGGIVGLAAAMVLAERHPKWRTTLFEKDAELATHQTGRNSGVIHSGLYYRPGSLKASLCVTGAKQMVAFCEAEAIPVKLTGKVVVATEPEELPRLQTLYERGLHNGVPGLERIGPDALRELEPNAAGLEAVRVPGAGLVDYRQVAAAYARRIKQRGGTVLTGTGPVRILRVKERWRLTTRSDTWAARWLIVCGGLHADRLAESSGFDPGLQIIPFRGEYYDVQPGRADLVRSMIYPVPDPSLPFLGVHFTRTVAGGLHAGPNAVLALKREGYLQSDVSLRDVGRLIRFPGFWRMSRRLWRIGFAECYRSFSKAAFVRALQRLVPAIQAGDLAPAKAGVRAQAVDGAGALIDDFRIAQTPGAIHVLNVPSPAATSSLAIANVIATMAAAAFEGRAISAAKAVAMASSGNQ